MKLRNVLNRVSSRIGSAVSGGRRRSSRGVRRSSGNVGAGDTASFRKRVGG